MGRALYLQMRNKRGSNFAKMKMKKEILERQEISVTEKATCGRVYKKITTPHPSHLERVEEDGGRSKGAGSTPHVLKLAQGNGEESGVDS